MDELVYQDCLRVWKETKRNTPIWGKLARKHNYASQEALRNKFKRERQKRGESYIRKDVDSKEDEPYRGTIEYKEDGSVTSDRIIKISDMDAKSPEKVMEAHGFDPKLWDVVACRSNFWHGQKAFGNGLAVLHQSRIVLRPKKPGITLEDIKEFFENLEIPKSKFVYNNPNVKNNNEKTLEIPLPDLHFGVDSFDDDGSIHKEFDAVFKSVMNEIIIKAAVKKPEKIILVPMGDIFHFDGPKRQTTAGTQMQSKFDYAYLFDHVSNLFISIINELSKIAVVEILYVGGNHDKAMGFFLIKALEYYYHMTDTVIVDSSPITRKWRTIYTALIGWVHGDMPKINATSWLHKEAKADYGNTKYAEIHAAHIHHQTLLEKDGVILRHLPTIIEPDAWHYEKGYIGNVRTLMTFLWNKNGLEEIWYFNV